ncbi:MAG: pyrroloquinoline quinone-dependent dehydrogenase [Gammaproteobacteria bacterium]|nr:pyrroloquinoline quinone-dependent dehydrogenase [Gammaproteobacteria bacterium]
MDSSGWLAAAAAIVPAALAEGAPPDGVRYSPLAQIHRGNVEQLELAWTYRTGELERRGVTLSRMQAFENSPALIAGSLVVCTPVGRLVALDPATGRERWVFEPPAEAQAPGGGFMPRCRGVAEWTDRTAAAGQHCRQRIVWGTWKFRVYAVDAGDGRPCVQFGVNGEVVLDPGRPLDADEFVQISSPPAVSGDVLIIGSAIRDSSRADEPRGTVRALDARTGALRWEFDPVPRDPADPAAATWLGDGAGRTGAANVWAPMAVDAERDLVFLPTSSPSPDYYGGSRPGDNRYANSLVALRGATGAIVWHFQTTHHDLWDLDLPAQPILVELRKGGRTIPAVVQLTKQGLVFVFERATGRPVFPIEERPVPQGGVEGEWLAPTQPFPTAPPPLVTPGMTPDDAWGFTPIDRWQCRKKIEALRHGPLYTPPSEQGTIYMPSFVGGANWGGGAWDPVQQVLYVNTLHAPGVVRLVRQDAPHSPPGAARGAGVKGLSVLFPQRGSPYRVETSMLVSPLGAPCSAPPWGRLSAVDLAQGTIRWQVALGSIEKLMPIPLPLQMGTPHAGGAVVTAGGLVFISATMDDKFRAYDAATGAVLWTAKLPAGGQATPVTYSAGGRQFVVLAAGGHPLYQTTPGDYVLAWTVQ